MVICKDKREDIRTATSIIYHVASDLYKKEIISAQAFSVFKVNLTRIERCCNLGQSIEELERARAELERENHIGKGRFAQAGQGSLIVRVKDLLKRFF